ncbi:MAG TPA: hypothetical protein DDY68_02660, partial [Porphyromonadaceae bacterium]|nr:hypothetical protein [Porphyromonadaceae bacterium]
MEERYNLGKILSSKECILNYIYAIEKDIKEKYIKEKQNELRNIKTKLNEDINKIEGKLKNSIGENRNLLRINKNRFIDFLCNSCNVRELIKSISYNFKHYTNGELIPHFFDENDKEILTYNETLFKDENNKLNRLRKFDYCRFTYKRESCVRISKGEESCFIWCLFYSMLKHIVDNRNSKKEFMGLEYIFIDDPVSSLDENHLIELAIDIAEVIKKDESCLKFIITTHNSLFYNVLHSELNSKVNKKKLSSYMLTKNNDNTFNLEEKKGDSNSSFSYHLFLKEIIEKAIAENKVQKYHLAFLRNLYERTANFLGYPNWYEILPEEDRVCCGRILNLSHHSQLSYDTVAEPNEEEKEKIKHLFNHLNDRF